MKIYLPEFTTDTVLRCHYEAYKELVGLGGLVATSDTSEYAEYAVSEREPWAYYDLYASTHNINNVLKAVCDKGINQKYFAEVGMPTIPTELFNDINLLKKYKGVPFIIKPGISAGSCGHADFTYTIFRGAEELVQFCKDTSTEVLLRNTAKEGTAIIQRSIAYPGEPYGQLHLEGFVNKNSEVRFSSNHEVEFINGRWTKQLKWNAKDNTQLESIKQRVSTLIKQHGIKNTMFTLQHVRSFTEGVWYPTDWQYRLSYNTVFGRRVANPEYVKSLVHFLVGKNSAVLDDTTNYYQKLVRVNLELTKQQLLDILAKYKVQYIPIQKNLRDKNNYFLFLSFGSTFEEAEATMHKFEKEVF